MILALIVVGSALAALLVVGLIFSAFYKRSSKEVAFVRTGTKGSEVFLDRGGLVLPIIHTVMPVSLVTRRFSVERIGVDSIYAHDKIRLDAKADFFVAVSRNDEAIQLAASTLGNRVNDPRLLDDLIAPMFDGALRNAAAKMEADEVLVNRTQFIAHVVESIQDELTRHGLALESVTLTYVRQTDIQYLNPNDMYDAVGMAKITAQVESRRKEKNEIEQTSRVEIQRKRTDADKQIYAIEQEGAIAEAEKAKAVGQNRSQTNAELEISESENKRKAEEAEVERKFSVNLLEMNKNRDYEIAKQEMAITIANKSSEQAAADAVASRAQAEAVLEAERVQTVREMEIANRVSQVAIIKATEVAQTKAVEITVNATAEREAAEDLAAADTARARAQKDADELRAQGIKAIGLAEAEAARVANEADNELTPAAAKLRLQLRLTKVLPEIIAQSVKPLENIESIRIVDLDGFAGAASSGCGTGAGDTANGTTVDRIYNASLNHRAMKSVVDMVVNEVGLGSSLADLATGDNGFLTMALKSEPEVVNPNSESAPVAPAAV